MRLPQDRILHIDTEFKDGKVNVVAEWQGELVRCKECDNTVPHWYMLNGKRVDCNWCVEMESEVDDDEYCSRAVPKGTRAKMKAGAIPIEEIDEEFSQTIFEEIANV